MGQKFGQHFLVNQAIIRKIIDEFKPDPDTHVAEIGPGKGALTNHLRHLYQLTLFEIDPKWINYWQQQGIMVIAGDVMDTSLKNLDENKQWSLIGNLPYQISGPFMAKIVEERAVIPYGWFMMQEEVVRRLAAGVGTKERGGLSVWLQRYYDVSLGFRVTKGCFQPPPKVQSYMVSLRRKEAVKPCVDERLLHRLIRYSFQYRRKTIRKILQTWQDDMSWPEPPFDWSTRPECLSEDDFIWIVSQLNY